MNLLQSNAPSPKPFLPFLSFLLVSTKHCLDGLNFLTIGANLSKNLLLSIGVTCTHFKPVQQSVSSSQP